MIIAIASEIWTNNPSNPDTMLHPGDSRPTTPIPSSSSLQPLSIVNLSVKPKDQSMRLPDTSFDFGTGYKRSGGPETTLEWAKLERERTEFVEEDSFENYVDRDQGYVEREFEEEEEEDEGVETVIEPVEPAEQEVEGEANVVQEMEVEPAEVINIDFEQEMDIQKEPLPIMERETLSTPATDKILVPLAPVLELDELIDDSSEPRLSREASPDELSQMKEAKIPVPSASDSESIAKHDLEIADASLTAASPGSLAPVEEEDDLLDDLWGDDPSFSPSSPAPSLPSALDSLVEVPLSLPLPVVNSPPFSNTSTNIELPLSPQIPIISSSLVLEPIFEASTREATASAPLLLLSSQIASEEILEPNSSSVLPAIPSPRSQDQVIEDQIVEAPIAELPVPSTSAVVSIPLVPDASVELSRVLPSLIAESLPVDPSAVISQSLPEPTISPTVSPNLLPDGPLSPPVQVVSSPLPADLSIEQPTPLLPPLIESSRDIVPNENTLTSPSVLPSSPFLLSSTYSQPPIFNPVVKSEARSSPPPSNATTIVWGSSSHLPHLVPSLPSFDSPINRTINAHDSTVFEPVFTPISVSIPDVIARESDGESTRNRISSDAKVDAIGAGLTAMSSAQSSTTSVLIDVPPSPRKRPSFAGMCASSEPDTNDDSQEICDFITDDAEGVGSYDDERGGKTGGSAWTTGETILAQEETIPIEAMMDSIQKHLAIDEQQVPRTAASPLASSSRQSYVPQISTTPRPAIFPPSRMTHPIIFPSTSKSITATVTPSRVSAPTPEPTSGAKIKQAQEPLIDSIGLGEGEAYPSPDASVEGTEMEAEAAPENVSTLATAELPSPKPVSVKPTSVKPKVKKSTAIDLSESSSTPAVPSKPSASTPRPKAPLISQMQIKALELNSPSDKRQSSRLSPLGRGTPRLGKSKARAAASNSAKTSKVASNGKKIPGGELPKIGRPVGGSAAKKVRDTDSSASESPEVESEEDGVGSSSGVAAAPLRTEKSSAFVEIDLEGANEVHTGEGGRIEEAQILAPSSDIPETKKQLVHYSQLGRKGSRQSIRGTRILSDSLDHEAVEAIQRSGEEEEVLEDRPTARTVTSSETPTLSRKQAGKRRAVEGANSSLPVEEAGVEAGDDAARLEESDPAVDSATSVPSSPVRPPRFSKMRKKKIGPTVLDRDTEEDVFGIRVESSASGGSIANLASPPPSSRKLSAAVVEQSTPDVRIAKSSQKASSSKLPTQKLTTKARSTILSTPVNARGSFSASGTGRASQGKRGIETAVTESEGRPKRMRTDRGNWWELTNALGKLSAGKKRKVEQIDNEERDQDGVEAEVEDQTAEKSEPVRKVKKVKQRRRSRVVSESKEEEEELEDGVVGIPEEEDEEDEEENIGPINKSRLQVHRSKPKPLPRLGQSLVAGMTKARTPSRKD